jgi:hypothetical protein
MDDTLPPRKPLQTGVRHRLPTLEDLETRTLPDAQERLGRYLLEAKIGEGGMGKVYRCHDLSLKRPVAVKVLHDRYSRDEFYQARFVREAETLASLSHPSIAQIFAIDKGADGALLIVMEYVEGRSVEEILRTDGVFPVTRAIAVAIEVAEGLKAAFEKGVIHRDVKPSNVLVRPDGHVKIVDFGLSKALTNRNSITDDGVVLGTPHYISPEQGRGLKVDERSDMYSLGATLYHMVTGAPPFSGQSQIAVIVAHVEDDPRPPHEIRARVPETASWVIGRMMAREPGERYTSYRELLDDLRCLDRGEPPQHARRDAGRFRLAQARRRKRRRGVALSALVLLAAGITGGWLLVRDGEAAPEIPSAERLGAWHRLRADGGAVLDLDFARPPDDPGRALAEALVIPHPAPSPAGAEAVHAPAIARGRALVWTNFRAPFACRYPFARLDEAQVWLDGLSPERFDLALALVDPDSSARRRLTLCVRVGQDTAEPLAAERHGDKVPIEPAPPPLPRFDDRLPCKLFLELEPRDGKTSVRVKVVEVGAGKERYRHAGALPGEDWARCAVVLKTSCARPPFTVALREFVLSGIPSGARLEEVPWRD